MFYPLPFTKFWILCFNIYVFIISSKIKNKPFLSLTNVSFSPWKVF